MRKGSWVLLAVILVLGTASVAGTFPHVINYQGILRDAAGKVVADGSQSVTFRFYDAQAAGNKLWEETQTVTTKSGLFNALLGSTVEVPDTVFANDSWLGIVVGTDPEMSPRTRVAAVAYAYRVETVDGAKGGTIQGDLTIKGGGIGGGTVSIDSTTRYYSITAADFEAWGTNPTGAARRTVYSENEFNIYFADDGPKKGLAPIHLPHGAEIRKVVVFIRAQNSLATLSRSRMAPPWDIQTLGIGNTGFSDSAVVSGIVNGTVNNAEWCYTLTVDPGVHGARVEYVITKPLP